VLLEDKVVVVPGVGPGLGRAMAIEAGAEGAKVVCVARSQNVIDAVATEIADAGGEGWRWPPMSPPPTIAPL